MTENFKKLVDHSFLQTMKNAVCKEIADKGIEIKKKSLSINDFKTVSEAGVELNDAKQIVDNSMYVEYELAAVSQRVLMQPIANFPLLDILEIDTTGATETSVVYKIWELKGKMGGSADKANPNKIIGTNAKAEAFVKKYIAGLTEDISVYELAVAIAKGTGLQDKIMRAIYLSFTKGMHDIIFNGTDGENTYKYNLNSVPGALTETASGTLTALITAGTTIKFYDDLVKLIAKMEAKGKGNAERFTPNVLLLPINVVSSMRTLMQNAGYFTGTIKEYIEKQLNLTIYPYAELTTKGILLNTDAENMLVGLPNPLEIYADTKYDTTSFKCVAQSTGFIVFNSSAVGYLTNVASA